MLIVTCQLGPQSYAIPAAAVREIVPLPHLRTLAKVPAFVRGVFVYRGQLTPVVDLSSLTLQTLCPERLSTRVIVVDVDSPQGVRPLGLLAEHVTDTIHVADDAPEPTGVRGDETPHLGPMIRLDDGRLLQCIDVARVLDDHLAETLFQREPA